jgi:hypothetical protein
VTPPSLLRPPTSPFAPLLERLLLQFVQCVTQYNAALRSDPLLVKLDSAVVAACTKTYLTVRKTRKKQKTTFFFGSFFFASDSFFVFLQQSIKRSTKANLVLFRYLHVTLLLFRI